LPFTVITNGSCVNPLVFSIRDAAGLQTTATLINNPGTQAPPGPPTPALNVVPQFPAGWNCTAPPDQFTVLISDGTPPYNISANIPGVTFLPGATPAAPGFVTVDVTSATPAPGSGTKFTFIVADSGSPQQTATFSKTCP
jgi:hypothetical protein